MVIFILTQSFQVLFQCILCVYRKIIFVVTLQYESLKDSSPKTQTY